MSLSQPECRQDIMMTCGALHSFENYRNLWNTAGEQCVDGFEFHGVACLAKCLLAFSGYRWLSFGDSGKIPDFVPVSTSSNFIHLGSDWTRSISVATILWDSVPFTLDVCWVRD
eukprot:442794_1